MMTDSSGGHADRVLDLLVVGGGPAGTAAAFRARELGLETLVLDFDDLMKRIRDYSKDKLILPGFGGGDRMTFPEGDALVRGLCFEAIDKDDLCSEWKGLYREHGIDTAIGLELTGLSRRQDGLWEATAWNHAARGENLLTARHVVLCLGRGVPRRFDIPGNTDGIGFRLGDPADYVGHPACVIGGGTSAAEAVIAISTAKREAEDASSVYWSYRGDRMPRISRALAEVFFEAYVGSGNIRYCPLSEPVAVVTAEDRSEYLAIRVDRRRMDSRPAETSHLEFPKEHCIACIGEDLPEGLLGACGISMVSGGPKNKKRMVVNRYLETCRENVYLAGDILSQAHFEVDDFESDPALFREVKHRGNIKSALRDGVLVAEVVRQRIDGKSEIELPSEQAVEAVESVVLTLPGVALEEALPASRLEPERMAPAGGAILTRLLPTGVEEEEYPVASRSVTTIGRKGCDIDLGDADGVADRHASISHSEEGYSLRDDGSTGALFLRLPVARERRVAPGDLLRLGRQFLRVSASYGRFSLVHFDLSGVEVGRHEVGDSTLVIGRDAPGVTLAADDKTLSRRQLAVSVRDGELFAKDLKSANGTFLSVRSSVPLEDGDRFRLGQHVFVFGSGAESIVEPDPEPAVSPVETRPSQPADATTPDTGAPSVRFKGSGKVIVVEAGQTLCEAAEAHGVELVAECHSGICGSDPVRILSGREHLDAEPEDQECDTLEDICEQEPGDCRLACMVRVTGPVEVEIL